MHPPTDYEEIHDGLRYGTHEDKATLLAGDDWWDGGNYERRHRNTFLYRGKAKGRYFLCHLSQWENEPSPRIEPVTPEEAQSWYSRLTERRVDIDEAFDGLEVEDA